MITGYNKVQLYGKYFIGEFFKSDDKPLEI